MKNQCACYFIYIGDALWPMLVGLCLLAFGLLAFGLVTFGLVTFGLMVIRG